MMAPTRQNLICQGKSVMEVILNSSLVINNGLDIREPTVEFFQRQTVKRFILFLDQGLKMRENGQQLWQIFRSGWEQFAILLDKNTTRFSIRFQNPENNMNKNITDITWEEKHQSIWENAIFPELIPDFPASIDFTPFQLIRENIGLMENLYYPEIVLVAGSDDTETNVTVETEVTEWINKNKIPVHVLTFSSLNNSKLIKISEHGSLYSGDENSAATEMD